ncbi:MAG: hypothetical protein ACOYOK_09060 [Pseudobdellovibrionaceae bacterium]
MKKLYWFGFAIVLVSGIVLSVQWGLQPRSVPKIKFSQVKTPEEFGRAIQQRLQQELLKTNVIFFGAVPGRIHDIELIRGFYDSVKNENFEIFVEPLLPYVELLDPDIRGRWDLKDQQDAMVEAIKQKLQQGKKILLVGPNIYSSQLIEKNPVYRLQHEKGLVITSFSIAPLSQKEDQLMQVEPKCVTGDPDPAGTSALGCMIKNKNRLLFRKKFLPEHYSGVMDLTGERDYLILFSKNLE